MAGGARRRVVGVCAQCRQDKVKCDSELHYPSPCTRCKARNTECTIDPGFRRVPARQRLKAMKDELDQLRTARRSRGDHLHPAPLSASESPEAAGRDADMDMASGDQPPPGRTPFGMDDPDFDSPPGFCFELQEHSFTAAEIRSHFLAYVQHFHPYQPILNLDVSAREMYEQTPFLFWTIFIISCRVHALQPGVQKAFYDPFLQLLRKVALASPLRLSSIQALVLMCTWPLPTTGQTRDPTWLYCNLAVAGMSFLNLNRRLDADGTVRKDARRTNFHTASLRACLATYSIYTSFGTANGTSAPLLHPVDIADIEAQAAQLPASSEIAAEAALYRVSAKYAGLTAAPIDFAVRETLVDIYTAEMDKVSSVFPKIWSSHLEYLATAAKLAIVVDLIIAQRRIDPENVEFDDTPGKSIVHRLLAGSLMASKMIAIFETSVSPRVVDDEMLSSVQRMLILPKMYMRSVAFAAFFLIRLCCTNPSMRETDRARSCRSVESARDSLRSASANPGGFTPGDEAARTARMIGMLLEHQKNGQVPPLQHIDRGCGSILWDSMRQSLLLRDHPTEVIDMVEGITPASLEYSITEHHNITQVPDDLRDLDLNSLLNDYFEPNH